MTTTIIAALKTYIKTYSGVSGGLVLVDALTGNTNEYAIVPLPGSKLIEGYVDGGSLRQFPFALQMMAYTADDIARIENNGFFEGVSDWLESQTNNDTLPTLNSNQHPERIESTSQPFLYQQGESETAIYQMSCNLIYKQDKP